jgi:hypothetical protein
MGGPIFLYNGANASPTQFPPQFNRKWLVSDCNGSGYGYRLLSFDADGNTVVGGDALKIFAGSNVHQSTSVVDMKQGPDGSLYIVDWGQGGIYRVDYTGTCKDESLLPEQPTIVTPSGRAFAENPIEVHGRALLVSLEGSYVIRVIDISGRTVYATGGQGKRSYELPALNRSGIFQVEVGSRDGVFTRRLVNHLAP